VEPEGADGLLRIGELSRRTGVSDHVLRAWERRYGLLEPARSVGGFRLYSAGDEDRVRRMQAHLDRGLSAAEAARAALAAEQATDGGTAEGSQSGVADGHASLAERARSLTQALDELDEPAAQTVLDRLLADYTVETVVRDVLTPYLHELGERWGREMSPSARSTSPPTCYGDGWPASPVVGVTATGHGRFSPARRVSPMISRC
jgi:DNA-binding transcriptional MerR regulator